MKLTRRGKLLTILVSMLIAWNAGQLWVNALTRWIHYNHRQAPTVIIKRSCLAAEDSAGHLKVLEYEGDRIVYGCYHRGY